MDRVKKVRLLRSAGCRQAWMSSCRIEDRQRNGFLTGVQRAVAWDVEIAELTRMPMEGGVFRLCRRLATRTTTQCSKINDPVLPTEDAYMKPFFGVISHPEKLHDSAALYTSRNLAI